MRPLLAAYYRLGHLVRELMKFGVVGGVAFVIDVGLFNLLLHLTDKPLTSKTLSTIVATTVSYAGNRHWTFRRRSRSSVRREYLLFFLLNGVGLAIALTCLAIVALPAGPHQPAVGQHRRERDRPRAGDGVPVLVLPALGVPRAARRERGTSGRRAARMNDELREGSEGRADDEPDTLSEDPLPPR